MDPARRWAMPAEQSPDSAPSVWWAFGIAVLIVGLVLVVAFVVTGARPTAKEWVRSLVYGGLGASAVAYLAYERMAAGCDRRLAAADGRALVRSVLGRGQAGGALGGGALGGGACAGALAGAPMGYPGDAWPWGAAPNGPPAPPPVPPVAPPMAPQAAPPMVPQAAPMSAAQSAAQQMVPPAARPTVPPDIQRMAPPALP
jgi:hypothetical protein